MFKYLILILLYSALIGLGIMGIAMVKDFISEKRLAKKKRRKIPYHFHCSKCNRPVDYVRGSFIYDKNGLVVCESCVIRAGEQVLRKK